MTPVEVRIALAQVNTTVGDLKGNVDKVMACVHRADQEKVDLVVFPELVLTGYPPEDLLLKPRFVEDNLAALKRLAGAVREAAVLVGFIDRKGGALYNAAALLQGGRVKGVYHKARLPNYGVFDEVRYFSSGKGSPVFGIGATAFGVSICEDIWHLDGPVASQVLRGARFIVNINASPYHIGKGALREKTLRLQAQKNKVPVVYVNCVGGQDELVLARALSWMRGAVSSPVPVPLRRSFSLSI